MNNPNDVLRRLQRAMPLVSAWIDQLLSKHAATATPVDRLGFSRLPSCFPASLLRDTKAVAVPRAPFPPVSRYGVPEFESMASMPMAGITFRNVYFITDGYESESLHFHELVHAIQWRVLGFDDFLLTYAAGVLQHGYFDSPLEAAAFHLQRQFEGGAQVLGILDLVSSGALRAQEAAAALFRGCGLTIGA